MKKASILNHSKHLGFLSYTITPRWDGSVVSLYASHVVGHGFTLRSGHNKDHHRYGTP